MSDRKTYRVKVHLSGYRTYEIDTETELEARQFFTEGVLIYDDIEFDDDVDVVEIDRAEPPANNLT